MSLIYNKNRNVRRTDPWETREVVCLSDEEKPSRKTFFFLSTK